MLIAGDGRTHVFKVNSLDPREWFRDREGETLRHALREANLLANRPPSSKVIREPEAWDYYRDMKFDLLLTNPPFAGEIRDRELLRRYELAKRALERKGKKGPKEERDVLFIERCLQMLKPGGRMAIILPQGKFNNSTLAYIREWILREARLLAVVGLHRNTFKPHTGTKTSLLFLQKYDEEELKRIASVEQSIQVKAPDFEAVIDKLLRAPARGDDIPEENVPEEIAEMLHELCDEPEEKTAVREVEKDERRQLEEPDMEALQHDVAARQKSLTDVRLKLEKAKDAKDKDGQNRLKKLAKSAKKVLTEAENALGDAERKEKVTTVRGRLELLRVEPRALETLNHKWVNTEIARKLDYPLFMATSEVGGKDSSGEYIYRKDEAGNIIEDEFGNPLIDQDCVKYRNEDPDGIAELFVQWAEKRKLNFWQGD